MVKSEIQAHFDDVTGIDFRWLSLTNACHQSFTVGGCATMETESAWNILNHYVWTTIAWG